MKLCSHLAAVVFASGFLENIVIREHISMIISHLNRGATDGLWRIMTSINIYIYIYIYRYNDAISHESGATDGLWRITTSIYTYIYIHIHSDIIIKKLSLYSVVLVSCDGGHLWYNLFALCPQWRSQSVDRDQIRTSILIWFSGHTAEISLRHFIRS